MKIKACFLALLLVICDARKNNNINRNNSAIKKKPSMQSGSINNIAVHSAGIAIPSENFPWIVNIFEIIPNQGIQKLGPGVLINKNYAVCHSKASDQIIVTENVRLVSKSNMMGVYSGRGIIVRTLVDFTYNFESKEGHNIGLLKFSYSSGMKDDGLHAMLPTYVTKNYDEGTEVKLYNYGDNLYTITKKVGPESDCASYGFNSKNTFCVEADADVKNNYPGTIAVIDKYYAGFCIGSGNTKGESYIDIRNFLPWIAKNFKN